jgi:SpoVK/Ycf46/Vps4 family AAA+-type ATPase
MIPENFVGREQEREALHRWLRHSWGSAIAVLGPAGTGKTALIRKFVAETHERSRPFIWIDAAKLRSVEDLWEAVRPQLRVNRQSKSVVGVLDNIDAFAGGSEREANRLREKFLFDRFERHSEFRDDFQGDLNWIFVGRKLPWRTRSIGPDERQVRRFEDDWKYLDEPPYFFGRDEVRSVVLSGLRESEIFELVARSLRDGPQLTAESRAGLATFIHSRMGGSPALTTMLIAEIKRTGDPLAAITALGSRTNLSISLADGALKVAASAELAPAQFEAPGGLVTVLPHLYLPKLGQRWRDAIHEFQALLNKPKLKEAELQKFFETHPHFLKGLDYSRMVAHPVLERLDGQGNLIPDFFLQPADGKLADIWDLKLPSTPLIVGTKDRLHLSSAVCSALAQVREYRDYFEDPRNKQKVADRYGLTAYRPNVAIVIGMNKFGLSEEKQKQIFDEVPKGAKVLTYDELLVRMKRHVDLHV